MNKRFVYFATKELFNAATLGEDYEFTSIVFIGNPKAIWNRGIFYAEPNDFDIHDYLLKSEAAATYQPVGNYLTEHQSLENYYTKSEVDILGNQLKGIAEARLPIDSFNQWSEGVAMKANTYTKAEVDAKLADYTNTTSLNGLLNTKADVSYVLTKEGEVKQWVEDKNYLTSHQPLTAYAKTADVQTMISTAKSEIIGGAGEDYDTLKEIETWIAGHQDLYDALVASNATKGFVESKIDELTYVYQPVGNYYTKEEVDAKVDDIDLTDYATKTYVSANYATQTDLGIAVSDMNNSFTTLNNYAVPRLAKLSTVSEEEYNAIDFTDDPVGVKAETVYFVH